VAEWAVFSVAPPNDDVAGFWISHKQAAGRADAIERPCSDEVWEGRDRAVEPRRFSQTPGYECGAPWLGWADSAGLEVLLYERSLVVASDLLGSCLNFLYGDFNQCASYRHALEVAEGGIRQLRSKAGRHW
jgi:hypothetical protein